MVEPTHHLQVLCAEEGEQPVTEHESTDNKMADDHACQEHHSTPPATAVGASSRRRRLAQYENRLELAELFIAIAESVKMWVSVVPWRVQVLYGGQLVLSTLRTEEETLPWPPDPGPLPDADDNGERLGESVDSEGEHEPGRTQAGWEADKTTVLYSSPCVVDKEGGMLEAGCLS